MIYLDKNYTPILAGKQVDKLYGFAETLKIDIKIIGLTPLCLKPLKLDNDFEYPFSLESVIVAILRVMQRADHLTLDHTDPSLISRVILSFFAHYRGFKFDKDFIEEFGLDKVIPLNMTGESIDIELPHNLVEQAKKCVEICSYKNTTPGPNPAFDQLIYLLNVYRGFFGQTQPSGKEA